MAPGSSLTKVAGMVLISTKGMLLLLFFSAILNMFRGTKEYINSESYIFNIRIWDLWCSDSREESLALVAKSWSLRKW